MKVSEKEVAAVTSLPGARRYEYFIKKVADQNQVWALWQGSWATGVTDEGTITFPVWPAREYAERCRTGDWAAFESRSIPLSDFLNELLPQLTSDGLRVSVFDTPSEEAVFVDHDQFLADVRAELAKIE